MLNFFTRGFWILILCPSLIFSEAPPRLFTPESVVDLQEVSQVVIQPQGNYIAYRLKVARGADEDRGGSYYELWVVDFEGKNARRYVSRPNSVSSINWTPDGKVITFLGKRTEFSSRTQVFGIPLDGGEAYPLTDAASRIETYAISADGSQIAYVMEDKESKEVRARKAAGFDAEVIGEWQTIDRIHVQPLNGGDAHVVTESNEHVLALNWSPDGRQLIYRASLKPFVDDKYMFTDNYIVDAGGGTGVKIHDTDGKLGLAALSPDGTYAAWLGAEDFSDPYPGTLFIKERASGQVLAVKEAFSGEEFIWLDETTLFLTVAEDTRKALYRISLPALKLTRISPPGVPIFGDLSVSTSRKRIAVAANTAAHPDEVFAAALPGMQLKRLTNSNALLADMPLGQQETIVWTGPDGLKISGILVKPVGYEAGKRYPLQVQVHGGPESARFDGWNTRYNRWVQLLAQRGIMVLIPNYRGSTGKGIDFARANQHDMMGKEFEDILAGVDFLEQMGLIDPTRVGIGGGSYGGYAAAWAATRYSERFAASVVFVGISNQISKGGMTDTPVENAAVHWKSWLYDDFEFNWSRSPLKYVSNARTPTLILHGERDSRVPVNQAYELHRGLTHAGAESELVIYPREGHGNTERAHQLDLCRRAVEWYVKHLLDTPSALN